MFGLLVLDAVDGREASKMALCVARLIEYSFSDGAHASANSQRGKSKYFRIGEYKKSVCFVEYKISQV